MPNSYLLPSLLALEAAILELSNWVEQHGSADSVEKSAMVFTVEKYTLEIKIFALSKGLQAQISRSGAQKRHCQRSVCRRSGSTDFFNRIGQKALVRSLASIPDTGADSAHCKFITDK